MTFSFFFLISPYGIHFKVAGDSNPHFPASISQLVSTATVYQLTFYCYEMNAAYYYLISEQIEVIFMTSDLVSTV